MLKLEFTKYQKNKDDPLIKEDKFVKMLLTYSGLSPKKQKQMLKVCWQPEKSIKNRLPRNLFIVILLIFNFFSNFRDFKNIYFIFCSVLSENLKENLVEEFHLKKLKLSLFLSNKLMMSTSHLIFIG